MARSFKSAVPCRVSPFHEGPSSESLSTSGLLAALGVTILLLGGQPSGRVLSGAGLLLGWAALFRQRPLSAAMHHRFQVCTPKLDYDSVVPANANEVIYTKLGPCLLPHAGGNRFVCSMPVLDPRLRPLFADLSFSSRMLYQPYLLAYDPPLIERSWEESGYPALTGAAVRYVAVVSPFLMIVSELLLATVVHDLVAVARHTHRLPHGRSMPASGSLSPAAEA
jgi:hypothetical protein